MCPGESIGTSNADKNQFTHLIMDNFNGCVVPIIIQKRERLAEKDSGLAYANYNVSTLKGTVTVPILSI
jgi:hypothetical protein